MAEDQTEMTQATTIAEFVDGVNKAFEQVAAVVGQIIQQVMPVVQQIYTALEERYQAAGAPYGEGHEGLMRWLEDMGKINRKQQEIERIQMYHETLVSARKLGEKIRAKAGEVEQMAEETTEQKLTRMKNDFGGSMTQIARSLNELEGVQYQQGAIQKEHSLDLIDIKKRLGRIENRLDGMATKQDVEDLRTQVLDSFKQMLAILEERLPKKPGE